jgi:hypothetical protein
MLMAILTASGCTLFKVEGPAFSGVTTVNPPCECPAPVPCPTLVPGVVHPSGVVPAS